MKKLFITLILLISSLSSLFAFTSSEVAGRWYMACATPVGVQRGYIDCNFTDNTDFTGNLNMFGHDNFFEDGFFFDQEFFFSGKIRFLFFNIEYSAVGTILSPSACKADIDSSSGTFKAIAARSEEAVDAWLEEEPFENWE